MSERELLLVALGPVQDFIATARRCQDLWFGSYLLSDLARSAARTIREAAGTDDVLVFPPGVDDPETSVANKVLARVAVGTGAAVAERTRAAVAERLREHAEKHFGEVDGRWFHRERAEKQIADLIEFFWVVVPEGNDYAAARTSAEALLARRKLTKTWAQPSWAEAGVPKSSMDGARESVIHEDAYDQLKDQPEALRRRYFVQPGERLCGVGLLKRIGCELRAVDDDEFESDEPAPAPADRPVFHSTSHVAALPLLTRIERRDGRAAVGKYLEALRRQGGVDARQLRVRPGATTEALITSPFDGVTARVPRTLLPRSRAGVGVDAVVLFEERAKALVEEAPAKGAEALGSLEERKKAVAAALKTLRKAVGLPIEPTAYYAYLLADGDRMGKALDAAKALEQHKKISKALEGFARDCGLIAAQHAGSLVYSGGDDVLALLPLHTALDCARALRDAFAEAMNPVVAGLALEAPPTLSVGLGVAHHLDPMSHARALAKQAEKLAKDTAGRDALAVVVDKRSGGTVSAFSKWSDDGQALDERLKAWARLYEAEALPDRAAFELEQVARVFERLEPGVRRAKHEAPDAEPDEARNEAVVALARRAVQRRRSGRGEEPLVEAARTVLEARLTEAKGSPDARLDIARLADELKIARQFLSAWRDAWGDDRAEEATP